MLNYNKKFSTYGRKGSGEEFGKRGMQGDKRVDKLREQKGKKEKGGKE